MKQYTGLLLLLLSSIRAFAAAGLADVADDDPNLFIVMVAMLLGFVVMLLAGLLIFAVCVGIVLLLAGLGIVSISVFSGWYHRSFAKGINTFFGLSFVAMGLVAGGLLLLVLNVFKVPLASYPSFCLLITGAGAAAGWVCFYVIKRIGGLLIEKLRPGG